jgi:undecaprenyl-diphosphatase
MEQFIQLDHRLSHRFSLSPETWGWQIARTVAHVGDGPYIFSGLGLVYLLGWLKGDAVWRWMIMIILLDVLLAMAVVTLIKYTVRRTRPRPPGEFVAWQYDKYSFPSGHAARLAALTVGVMRWYPGWGYWVGIAALGVAIARVLVGVHYVGDIIAGLILGGVVSGLFLYLFLG